MAQAPYDACFNIDTVENLRAVTRNPAELAPSGISNVRIHGTFVSLPDLSPAIQAARRRPAHPRPAGERAWQARGPRPRSGPAAWCHHRVADGAPTCPWGTL